MAGSVDDVMISFIVNIYICSLTNSFLGKERSRNPYLLWPKHDIVGTIEVTIFLTERVHRYFCKHAMLWNSYVSQSLCGEVGGSQ